MANNSEKMKALLAKLGLGFEHLSVIGEGRVVTVFCTGRNTADKWAMALGEIFAGSKVRLVSGHRDAATNKHTVNNPTKRAGFYVSVEARGAA